MRILAFENEDEASEFCEHYGFFCEDGKVFLERNAFIMPESSLARHRSTLLVESKQGGSAGEVRINRYIRDVYLASASAT